MRRLLIGVAVTAALLTGATSAGATTPEPPTPAVPVTAGPVTATVVESYHSSAASQLVAVIEVTTTETVSLDTYGAVYVGPDGQQVEATDSISADELFPGAISLVVFTFPAVTPGGTIIWSAYDDDYNQFDLISSVPAKFSSG